jgi:hypothetical protein
MRFIVSALVVAVVVAVSGLAQAAETVSIPLTGVQLRNATNQSRDSAPNALTPAQRYTYSIDGLVRGRGGALGSLFPNPTPLAQVLEQLAPGSSDSLRGQFWNLAGTHPISPEPTVFSGSTVLLGITITFSATVTVGVRADGVAFFSLTDVVLSPSFLTGYLEFTSGAAEISRVACAADLNGDGVIDFNDLLEFLNLYNASDSLADVNTDGVVDFNDFLAFLNIYNTPC